jgi:hypothetical protein
MPRKLKRVNAAGEQVPEEDAVDGDVVDAEFEEVREDDKR